MCYVYTTPTLLCVTQLCMEITCDKHTTVINVIYNYKYTIAQISCLICDITIFYTVDLN